MDRLKRLITLRKNEWQDAPKKRKAPQTWKKKKLHRTYMFPQREHQHPGFPFYVSSSDQINLCYYAMPKLESLEIPRD